MWHCVRLSFFLARCSIGKGEERMWGHRMVLSVWYAEMRVLKYYWYRTVPVQRNGKIKQNNYSTVVQLRFW